MEFINNLYPVQSTVWPEILAGRYFGELPKICHLAEFTLAVEPVLSHNDIHSKIERAGNLTGRELVSAELGRNR